MLIIRVVFMVHMELNELLNDSHQSETSRRRVRIRIYIEYIRLQLYALTY